MYFLAIIISKDWEINLYSLSKCKIEWLTRGHFETASPYHIRIWCFFMISLKKMCYRVTKEIIEIVDYENSGVYICDIWVIHVGLGNISRCVESKVNKQFWFFNFDLYLTWLWTKYPKMFYFQFFELLRKVLWQCLETIDVKLWSPMIIITSWA